ncbi:MAG TPA: DUF4388 domain-containing protein [Longimicrobiales bacterium]|nr:DUF4388 domain-containing protein [Longimicrobiales bacterium]
MAIEGPLHELGLEDVLQLLDLTKKTGVLHIRSERHKDEVQLHFEEGELFLVRRRRPIRRLGEHLVAAGRITDGELRRAVLLKKQHPDQLIGHILVEMGSVSQEELERQLRFHLEESVYDLLAWREGEFRFIEGEVEHANTKVRVRVESMLMEGARRIDEWSRLQARIPNMEAVPSLTASDGQEGAPLDLRPDEWAVMAAIDGDSDLRRIAAGVGRGTFEVAKIVYGLLSTGIVTIESARPRGPRGALESSIAEAERLLGTGDSRAAEQAAREVAADYPERAEPHLLEGRALAAQGRMRAATEAFARAAQIEPTSAEAHFHLGFTAARTGDLERARHAWETFLALGHGDERAPLALRGTEALRTLAFVLRDGPYPSERERLTLTPASTAEGGR